MDGNLPLIVIALTCVVLSAFFSATETAFSTFNRIRLKAMAGDGNRRAERALRMSEDYDKLLTTILIGNNIVNILGTSVATVLFTNLLGNNGVTVSTVVMTIVVLVFGEISPKSLAKESPEAFAMFAAPLIGAIAKVLLPVNFLFTQWKKLLSKVFKPQEEESIIEEELMTLVDEAQSEGDMDAHEGELIRSAIEFNDLDVQDILTPRVDITGLEDTATMQEAEEVFRQNGYSRLPVYHDSMDNIVGILHEKDFYDAMHRGVKDIRQVMKMAVYAPPTLPISRLLQLLKAQKTHMAVVLDEFGGTMGIVTMEDVLEELVGEIFDEHDDVTVEIHQQADGSWIIDGGANLEDVLELFEIHKEYEADTVGGWIAEEMDCIPKEGQGFDLDDLHVDVVRMDKRRVQAIRVVKNQNA
ncbi:MAG: HlyC/CorC family transporter [Clostridia bacterium]|nr:HlyC/CorC family transporter [Clostridia bacterium]